MLTDQQVLQQQDNPVPPAASLPMSPDPKAVSAARAVVDDALGRLIRREATAITKAAGKPDFRAFLSRFYCDFAETMTTQLSPAVTAYAAISGQSVDLPTVVSTWCGNSQEALAGTADMCLPEQLPEAIGQLTTTWTERTIL
jgi:hypothetical protein